MWNFAEALRSKWKKRFILNFVICDMYRYSCLTVSVFVEEKFVSKVDHLLITNSLNGIRVNVVQMLVTSQDLIHTINFNPPKTFQVQHLVNIESQYSKLVLLYRIPSFLPLQHYYHNYASQCSMLTKLQYELSIEPKVWFVH